MQIPVWKARADDWRAAILAAEVDTSIAVENLNQKGILILFPIKTVFGSS